MDIFNGRILGYATFVLKKICTLQKFLEDELRREAKFAIRSDSFIIIFFFPSNSKKKHTLQKPFASLFMAHYQQLRIINSFALLIHALVESEASLVVKATRDYRGISQV